MEIYRLSPSERRQVALARKQERDNRTAYKQYIKQKAEYEKRVNDERLRELAEEKKRASQDFFTRGLYTIGDIASNIIIGASKGLEGIYDFGVGLVGAVGGIFDDNFKDNVQKHISDDWTMRKFGNEWQDALKYSYTKNGGIVENIASGLGQMLPAVAVSVVTGGAGASAAVAQGASLATMGASAAGNATEQAFNDGADYYKGLGYGLASGAVEVATEKIFGGATKDIFGKGMLDDVGKSVAKTGAKRVAKNALEEGVEEVVSELANPALKSIYKGKEAFEEYKDSDYWKGVGQAGLVGGLTSMAYGGTVGKIMHTSGKDGDIKEALSEYNTLTTKTRNLESNGKLDDITKNGKSNRDIIFKNKVDNLRIIEQTLKNANEDKRAKLIKRNGLTEMFDKDGSIKSEFALREGLSEMVEQSNEDGTETLNTSLASQPKKYRTAFSDDRAMQEALNKGGATPFVGEMTEEQSNDFSDFVKAVGEISKKSNGAFKFVVGENFDENAYIDESSGVVVMNIDQFGKGSSGVEIAKAVLTSDMWQQSLIHEAKHGIEGTKYDWKLDKHFAKNEEAYSAAVNSLIQRGYLGENRQQATEKFNYLLNKVGKGEVLTERETKDYALIYSEVNAIMAENILGNENFIKKLLRDDISLAQRLVNRISDMKDTFASLKSKSSREAFKYLQKAEGLYIKAIEEVGGKYRNKRIIGINDKDEKAEDIDNQEQKEYNTSDDSEVQLSRKDKLIYGTFPNYKEGKGTQANELSTRWAHRADIEVGDKTAISYNNSWYLIEKFDDSDLGYQIIDKLTEKEYLTYEEEIQNGNRQGQSIQKGISRFASLDRRKDSAFQGNLDNDSARSQQRGENYEIRGVGKEQSQRRETQSNRSGNSKGGGQGGQVKLSRENSNGEVLSNSQVEFFKNSENEYNKNDDSEVQLSRKFKFQHKNFPGESESHSEAHRLAIWWASNKKTLSGDQTLISMNDRWYLVEKFDDALNNYQVEDYITKSEFDKIAEEIKENGRSGKICSIQRGTYNIDKLDRQRNSNGREGQGANRLQTEHRGKDSSVQQVGKGESQRGQIARNERGNSQGGGQGGQVKLSRKNSNGEALSDSQAEFFKDSKVRDENGNLLVVYHGTDSEFYTFDRNKLGKGIDQFGSGYYFTTNKNGAEHYGKRVVEAYLNIKNPFEITMTRSGGGIDQFYSHKITESQAYKILKEHPLLLDEEASPLGDYSERFWEEGATESVIREVASQITEIGALTDNAMFGHYPNELNSAIKKVLHYDGIKVDLGEGNYYFIAWEENQIKATSNKTPTQNNDIRFSLKIGNENVTVNGEGTKNLVALHNLSEENLLKVLNLNGLPMPSIAITKTEMPYEDFGDISLVFNKDTIDPQKDNRNKVYSRDAWTPSFGTLENNDIDYNEVLASIVDAMQSDISKGNNLRGMTPEVLAAKLSKEFESVEEIKENSKFIKPIDNDAEYYDFINNVSDMIEAIVGKMIVVRQGEQYFDKYIKAGNIIGEIADKKLFSLDEISSYMQQEYKSSYNYSKGIGNAILDLFAYVKQMTSTDYFEAKPNRVVGLEEIQKVLIPKEASAKVINELDKKGVEYIQYDTNNEYERKRIIQSLDDVKFSKKENNDGREGKRKNGVSDNNGSQNWERLVDFSGARGRYLFGFREEGKVGETIRKIENYVEEIAEHSQLKWYDEEAVLDIAKKTGIEKVYFCKMYEGNCGYIYVDNILFLPKDITIQDSGIIFEKIKPYRKITKNGKTAHISQERWNSFVKEHPETFVARIKIIDFLELSADRLTQRYIFDEKSELDSQKIKDIGYPLYLEVDFDNKQVVGHEGRHRMTALQEAGYTYTDIFIIPTSSINTDYINSIELIGQRNYEQNEKLRKVTIEELVRANSNKYTKYIETKYIDIKDDGIKYSKKSTDENKELYKLTKGQIIKLNAQNNRYKVYTRTDAQRIVNNILSNYMSFGEKYGDFKEKTKTEAINMLWQGLNSAEKSNQGNVALDIAEYIIQNSVLESTSVDNIETQWAVDIINALTPYLHKLNLDSIKSEIASKYDKDNSVYLRWGKRKGTNGLGVDTIVAELEEEGISIEATNTADIFFEIDEAYKNAIKTLKTKSKELLAAVMSEQEQKQLKQNIAREILKGFDYTGSSSELAKVTEKYRDKIADLTRKLKDTKEYNRAVNRLLEKIQKIKDWKSGAFFNSSQYKTKLFKGSILRLGNIKYRGNLNQSGTRRILAGLKDWYVQENPIINGVYNEEIASILEAVSQNQKPLEDIDIIYLDELERKSGIYGNYAKLQEWYTKENVGKGYSIETKTFLRDIATETTFTTKEIKAIENVVDYFHSFIENFDKVYRNGKYVEAKPIVDEYIDIINRNKNVKVGYFASLFDKLFNHDKASYLQTFADPMSVARYMDKYEKGFYTEMLERLREGAMNAAVLEMETRETIDEFFGRNKNFIKDLEKRTVKYNGEKIPIAQAFSLYMTLKRDQALFGLAKSGFCYKNGKEIVREDGFFNKDNLTIEEAKEFAKTMQDSLYKQFNEVDREYILIAENLFNNDCKELKQKTDIIRQGYSNILEGYYMPICRANNAKNVDTSTFIDEMNRVSNASFNKDTIANAKGELYIEPLSIVLNRHIHAVCQYASLATVIDEYNMLYNLDVNKNPNKPISVKTEGQNAWEKGNDYFKQLISDIQGISLTKGVGDKAMRFIRGGYAKYQLGANPKVWFTQLSSFFASSSILDYNSIVKGIGIKADDVDEYCALAKLRNYDNSAAKAIGVLDKVDKVGNILMKPIGMVDRFVVKKLFGACQVQVEKDSKLKIGTAENKIKAGELLTKVIFETQQNSLATERSSAMRSSSEFMKTLTMFTADSMKVFGRVVDAIGEVSILKAKIKVCSNVEVKVQLQSQLKVANKKAKKAVAALVATAVFMALIAQGFRWLYDKDDEEDNVALNMTVDAIGNLMGGLPLIKDVYAKFTEGYNLNNYAYSTINDLLDSFSSIVTWDSDKPAQKVKNLIYSAGQLFGIPTRNMYNITYGLTKRFRPEAAYKIDSAFYNKNYAADLSRAVKNQDEDMIATIVGIMLNERVGAIEDDIVRKELNALVSKEYQVMPKSIGNTITYNEEVITLTSRQKEQFKRVYCEANKEIASLVRSKQYNSSSDTIKAKSIKFIYDIYYNLALEDLLGVDLETKNLLFAKAVDIPSLAIIVSTVKELNPDIDKDGKSISGTKKAKVQTYVNSLGLKAVQKYMIMGYLGYKNKYGARQVKAYIQGLKLSKAQKELLYSYSGY